MSFLGVSYVELVVVEVAELAEQLGYWLVYRLDVCPDIRWTVEYGALFGSTFNQRYYTPEYIVV
jgi:hypothetical protein